MRRRLPILVVLLGLVAAAVLFDESDDDRTVATSDLAAGEIAIPSIGDLGDPAASWYCAGGTGEAGGAADHTVVITNPTARDASVLVTAYPGRLQPRPPGAAADLAPGETTTTTAATTTTAPTTTTTLPPLPDPVEERIEVPGHSAASVRLGDLVTAPYVAALVEAAGTAVAVEHVVIGEHGRDAAPCASSPSSTWHFAWGSTRRDAREVLAFFNPFPDAATVDISLATDGGRRDPVRFQGLVVPGRGVTAVDVGEDVTRRDQVSATVTVRAGRIVADRIQLFNGALGPHGLTVTLGTPQPDLTWVFPDGEVRDGLRELYVVYNPSDRPAEAELDIRLADPGEEVPPEPFALTIAERSYQIVDVGTDERVPKEAQHSGIVRSLNGVPLVAERVLLSGDPAPRSGISTTAGSPVGADTWVFAVGSANDTNDEWITVLNLDDSEPVTLDVTALAGGQPLAVAGLQGVEVPAAGRVSLRLGERVERDDLPLLLEATGPVVAERALYRAGSLGMSHAIGIPVRDQLYRPPPLTAG